MKTHKDLDVWKKSIDFVTEIYRITKQFPEEEKFGLSNQLRRASISIPSNIAEGAARKGKIEFKQFLYIALSSSVEIDTQLIIAKNLDFITNDSYLNLISELSTISKMIQGLLKTLKV
ncbi:MAG: four helix bundle protein [Ignavibacteriae bacterium]|nr:four helix bundle protein [Ignavibacteriota bacterium]